MCIIMSPAAVVKHKKEAQGAERRDDEEEGGGKRNGEGEEGAEEAQDDQEEFKDEENNKVEPIDPMSILANVKEVLTIYSKLDASISVKFWFMYMRHVRQRIDASFHHPLQISLAIRE